MREPIERVIIGAGVIYCVYELGEALRNGYFPESPVRWRRKITLEKQPGLYWTNFAFVTLMLILGIVLLAWNLVSAS